MNREKFFKKIEETVREINNSDKVNIKDSIEKISTVMNEAYDDYSSSLKKILETLTKNDMLDKNNVVFSILSRFSNIVNVLYYYEKMFKEQYQKKINELSKDIINMVTDMRNNMDDQQLKDLVSRKICVFTFILYITEIIKSNVYNAVAVKFSNMNNNCNTTINEAEIASIINDMNFIGVYMECLMNNYELMEFAMLKSSDFNELINKITENANELMQHKDNNKKMN